MVGNGRSGPTGSALACIVYLPEFSHGRASVVAASINYPQWRRQGIGRRIQT